MPVRSNRPIMFPSASKLLVAILFLTGIGATACAAPAPWVKETASAEDYRRDVSWCEGAVELEVGYLSDSEYFTRDLVEMETFDSCMRERGWRRQGEALEKKRD